MKEETPVACDLTAITDEDRPRYKELAVKIRTDKIEVL
jgi:hypothetical protein